MSGVLITLTVLPLLCTFDCLFFLLFNSAFDGIICFTIWCIMLCLKPIFFKRIRFCLLLIIATIRSVVKQPAIKNSTYHPLRKLNGLVSQSFSVLFFSRSTMLRDQENPASPPQASHIILPFEGNSGPSKNPLPFLSTS